MSTSSLKKRKLNLTVFSYVQHIKKDKTHSVDPHYFGDKTSSLSVIYDLHV